MVQSACYGWDFEDSTMEQTDGGCPGQGRFGSGLPIFERAGCEMKQKYLTRVWKPFRKEA